MAAQEAVNLVLRAERYALYRFRSSTDVAVELLCEDHVGTYTLPFCTSSTAGWASAAPGLPIEADVIGWHRAVINDR